MSQEVVRRDGKVRLVLSCRDGLWNRCSVINSVPAEVSVLNFYVAPTYVNLVPDTGEYIMSHTGENTGFTLFIGF